MRMSVPFFEQPILNSPYAAPTRHHALDAEGQPLDEPPRSGRRESKFLTPVPRAKKHAGGKQASLALSAESDSSGQEYNPTPIVNEIRGLVEAWRRLSNPADWGVTPVTQRLLRHWRDPDCVGTRPFFCQIEAVETIVWLTEVARGRRRDAIQAHLDGANAQSNPGLNRLACKMATGSGKTTVMAMLIAWQALNAARSDSKRFSRGFLIVAPGITIKDRLRVLLPADGENYYEHRGLVPSDMLRDLAGAKVVITNYHAFRRTETMEVSKVGRALLRGRGPKLETEQTEGEMLREACGELMRMKNVVVINDEAHHCYREKLGDSDEEFAGTEEREEAKENREAARLWISGIEALDRKVGVRAVYDLSATPFFLRGSGYREGTLFPWVVSDFNLMDAIESGIVKLPRVPVSDEDAAIGALLHDAAEDCGGRATLDLIRHLYGDAVAQIVEDCTDSWIEPKPAWRPRKEAYIASLDHKQPTSLLVSLADKTHNVRAILGDYREHKEALWSRFSSGRDTLWYYGALADAFGRRLPGRLASTFRDDVAALVRISAR